jgi:hypothetical protein
MKHMTLVLARLLALFVSASLLSGCLEIRTTEHRIKVNEDGSADHALRMIDIRSNAAGDSAIGSDYRALTTAFQDEIDKQFDAKGRKISDKKLYARGDTLIGELTYHVREISHIEGLRVTADEIFVNVGPEREIVRTNGKISPGERNQVKIAWDRDATRILYIIRERNWGGGALLGPWHRGEKR